MLIMQRISKEVYHPCTRMGCYGRSICRGKV